MDQDTQQTDDEAAKDKPKNSVKSAKDPSIKDTRDTKNKSITDKGKSESTEKAEGLGELILLVTAKVDGIRRAGCEWHGSTEVRVSDFTEEQLEQLVNEPKLHVTRVAG